MKLIYLAHPVRGKDAAETVANLERAKRWLKWAHQHACCAPIAPWITSCEIFDESDPMVRDHGLACVLAIVERCDEIWLCGGRISEGMRIELDHAIKRKLPVRDFTALGNEPPKERA